MKPIALTAALSLALASTLFSQSEEGFTPMFNGKDLTGWRPVNVAADTFRWENDMVVISGVPTGFMATERMYENFILECDWQHMKEGGNSGIFIWGEGLPAPGVPYARGIEVQVLDLGYETQHPDGAWKGFTSHGDIFPIWGADMTPVEPIAKNGKRSFPSEKRVKPSPEWNHYRVECNNGEIRLSVNGKQVTVGKDCYPRKGFICLESEGSEAHFKNVRIKELPSSGLKPELVARGFEGFKQLFNGKDFTGWKVSDEIKSAWTVSGLHATAKADVKGKDLSLWSERSFKDFVLIADWKLFPKTANAQAGPDAKTDPLSADSGIFLRGSTKAQVNIHISRVGSGEILGYRLDEALPSEIRAACSQKVSADVQPGKWNRFFITMKGDRCTVVLNDQVVIEDARLPGIPTVGPIGLQYHNFQVEFANLFIKEL